MEPVIIGIEIPEEPAVNLLRYLKIVQRPDINNVLNLILADYLRNELSDKDLMAIDKIKRAKIKDQAKIIKDEVEKEKPDWDLSKKEAGPITRATGLTKKELDILIDDNSIHELRFR